jgi:hypothetical protein
MARAKAERPSALTAPTARAYAQAKKRLEAAVTAAESSATATINGRPDRMSARCAEKERVTYHKRDTGRMPVRRTITDGVQAFKRAVDVLGREAEYQPLGTMRDYPCQST